MTRMVQHQQLVTMLRIIQLADAASAKAYYKASDYFLDGQELPGVWGGRGAELLGLTAGAEIDKRQFDRLCDNRHPLTDEQLTARHSSNRRVGWDMNWHAPKSVSVAFELLGDERVLVAFRDAVSYAMGQVEGDLKARVRVAGADEDRTVGNAVHATFVHRTARPVNGTPDPHLHAHSVVWNAVFDDVEGQWKAAQIGDIQKHSGYYAALMQSRLAANMAGLGYGVERKGRYWEVAGVPQSVVDKFSRRTALIEEAAAARGIENQDWKGELGAKTRERKQPHLSPEQLRQSWISRLTDSEHAALTNLPGQSTPLPSPADAMGYAIRHHFERSSVVPEKRVFEEALRFGVGSVDLDGLKREADRQGLIVKGDRSTTREALAMERRLAGFARDGKGTRRKLGEGRLLASRLPPDVSSGAAPRKARWGTGSPRESDPITLNAGQSTAVRHILASKDRVLLVRGAAGTGKTTMLKAAVEGMNAPVRAVGVTSTAAEELAKEVTPHSSTLARFLLDERMQDEVKGGVVLVDEASLVGTRQMDRLVGILERVDARAVLVGDLAQHSGVAAGSPFRALQEVAKLPVVEVTEIMRQSGLYKEVSARLSKGQTDQAIDLLDQMGWVKEAGTDERMRGLVGDYLDAVHKKRSVIVVAPTRAEGEAVTDHIRNALKAEGKLGDEREFETLKPVNWTEAEKTDLSKDADGLVAVFHRKSGRHAAGSRVELSDLGNERNSGAAARTGFSVFQRASLAVSAGDVIRITANGKDKSGKHRLLNGSTYSVKAFTRAGDLVLNNGWTVPRDYGHIAHGYVTTSHASQGKTVDTVLVAESSQSFAAAGREQFYVSLSRAKRHAYLYTDSLAELRDAVRQERGQSNAHDLIDDQFIDASKLVNRVKAVSLAQARLKGIARKARQFAKSLGKHKHKEKYGYDVG